MNYDMKRKLCQVGKAILWIDIKGTFFDFVFPPDDYIGTGVGEDSFVELADEVLMVRSINQQWQKGF